MVEFLEFLRYNYDRSERQSLGEPRGKSGQHRTQQSLTATVRKDRESATETKLPRVLCKVLWLCASDWSLVARGKGEKSEVRAHSGIW